MMLVEWSRMFEIGVPKIDAEHRHLVSIVNAFHDVYESGAGRGKVFTVLNLLVKYVETHFRSEEALMEAGEYPNLLQHRREHDKLTDDIFRLNAAYETGRTEISRDTMEFLKTWLMDHILQMDKQLEPFFQARGIPAGWEKPVH